jgi:hypothetical protein
MSILPFMLFSSGSFTVEHVLSEGNDSVGTTLSKSSISLGPPETNRTMYVIVSGRTNTTTGSRRFLDTAKVTIGGVDYNGTRIAAYGTSSDVGNPIAVYKIPIPVGTVGTFSVTVSGTSTALAGFVWSFWITRNGSDTSSGAVASTSVTVTGNSGGVILHLNSGNTSAGYGGYTVQDSTMSGNGIVGVSGRVFPTASSTTTLTSTGNRSAAVLLESM